MKKTILPALAMLIISAVMLSTASYAWFAMNQTVEANGMTVNVKSDSLYLLILAAEKEDTVYTADQVQAGGLTFDGGEAIGDINIYPSAYYKTEGFQGDNGYVAKGGDLKDATKWYYATAKNPGTHEMETGSDEALTGFDGYVVRYRYYVVLADGSNKMDTLKIKALSIVDASNDDGQKLDPVRVVVACGDQMEEFDQIGAGSVDLTGSAFIDDKTALEICVYVYYDGNDPSVTTNDVAALSSANITFTLEALNAPVVDAD